MESRFSHLTYIYEFYEGQSATIDTSFVEKFSDIKTEFIEQTPEKSLKYSRYPKGFDILIEQYADKITYYTNYPLKEISTGKYVIVFPFE